MAQQQRSAFFTFLLTLLLCTTLAAAEPATPVAPHYVTLEAIRQSLPAAPVIVGFDVDDTVLFSSPGFSFGAHNREAPGGKNRYGDDYVNNPQFWKDLNQNYDRYSMKKQSGDALLQMHKGRGDRIVFITRRTCYDDDAEVLKKRLNGLFNVQAPVYCTNEQTKTPIMTATGVDIFYGDADTDIEYAAAVQAKHVRAIRVERSRLSTNVSGYHPGMFGEEVLAGSDN
jgi:acid phosphatase (class B)